MRGFRRWGIAGLAVVVCLTAIVAFAGDCPTVKPDRATQEKVMGALNAQPIAFEANQGQTDPRVQFLSRGLGYSLFLTRNEAVLSVDREAASSQGLRRLPGQAPEAKSAQAVIRMTFPGASASPRIWGLDQQAGNANYFIGDDPGKWRTGVPRYGRVLYEQVYPGVDLCFYGAKGRLEFDFVLKPGADPDKIRLAFDGAEKVAINPAGDLVITTKAGEIIQHKPVIYQEVNGQRREVAGRFEKLFGHRVRFRVADYDRSRGLVIDPAVQLAYSGYLGGSATDNGWDIAVDQFGNAYITGYTNSAVFPTTIGAAYTTIGLGFDAFLACINSGGGISYCSYLGGGGNDYGNAVAVDNLNNAYVTGQTFSGDFPRANPIQLPYPCGAVGQPVCQYDGRLLHGASDAFLTKFNSAGSAVLYSTYVGGSGTEIGSGIGVWDLTSSPTPDVFLTGQTNSGDFPPVPPPAYSYHGPYAGTDIYLTKLMFTPTPNPVLSFVYSTYLGGAGTDIPEKLRVDTTGAAYLTGYTDTAAAGLPITYNPSPAAAGTNAFVAKFNPAATALSYFILLGGSGTDAAWGLALDFGNEAFVAGQTDSADFPMAGSPFYNTFRGGDADAWLARINAAGTALLYSTYFGGSATDFGYGIGVDEGDGTTLSSVNFYLAGQTSSLDLPTNYPYSPGTLQGPTDAFVTKFRPPNCGTPPCLSYSTYLGGSASDGANAIAVDGQGFAYITGSSTSANYPTVAGPGGPSIAPDAIATKISECNVTCSATVTPNPGQANDYIYFEGFVTVTNCQGTPVFEWDFGDGTAHGTLQSEYHQYVAAGTYHWTFTVTIPGSGASCSTSGDIVIAPGCSVTCSATVAATGVPGVGVSFVGASTPSNCSSSATYWWDFGDNTQASGQSLQHVYASAGTYHWQLTVCMGPGPWPPPGDCETICQTEGDVVISACNISCTATVPATGWVGQELSFAATATSSNCSTPPPTYSWTFGDGASSNEQNPKHTYTSPATYHWVMTATIGGATCVRQGDIVISECTLTCTASAPATGLVGIEISFTSTATSSCPQAITYKWDFGDSGSAATQNAKHIYTTAGTYTWTYEASIGNVKCTATGTITITACSLTCSASVPVNALVNTAVAFAGASSASSCVGTPIFLWEFGDGTTSSLLSPTHSYADPGTYAWTFTVTVTGPSGDQTCKKYGTINVCSLTCSASAQPATGSAPLTVSFKGDNAPGCNGTVTYVWIFGDGTANSNLQNPSHTYTSPGTYTWTMNTMVNGFMCSQTGTIVVCGLTCSATVPASGAANLAVNFTATGTLAGCTGLVTYLWSFGDGVTSTLQSPTHAYANGGIFPWSVTVTANGMTCSRTGTISVSRPPIISQMKAKNNPFKIVVKGSNLRPGIRVWINGLEWTNFSWKSNSKIVLLGDAALKNAAPANMPLNFKFVNPDGANQTVIWQY